MQAGMDPMMPRELVQLIMSRLLVLVDNCDFLVLPEFNNAY